MQQYFVNEVLYVDDIYDLDDDVLHHLKNVLRAKNHDEFRLVDSNQHIFLCEYLDTKAKVIKQIDEYNELNCDITAVVSLIKNDKFDLTLQKLTELGVKRIVPYKANRSVVKEGKSNNKIERFKKIVKEASEQSHRNIIPEICDYCDIKSLKNYLSDINLLAYEKETNKEYSLKANSITILIGPEGGFETKEVEEFIKLGFNSISLGNRILRAETAAIYLTSIIVGANQ